MIQIPQFVYTKYIQTVELAGAGAPAKASLREAGHNMRNSLSSGGEKPPRKINNRAKHISNPKNKRKLPDWSQKFYKGLEIDNVARQKKSPIKDSFYATCFEIWNNTPLVTRHNTSVESKTIQRVIDIIDALMDGMFNARFRVDGDFMSRNKIPTSWLTRKWSKLQIMRGIERLGKLYIDGYWPHDKDRLPKSLCDALYNPRTGSSMFLMVCREEPRPLSFPEEVEKNPQINRMLEKELFQDVSSVDKRKLDNIVERILKFRREGMRRDPYGRVEYWFGTDYKFCSLLVDWIKESEWISGGVSLNSLDPSSRLFEMFLKDQSKEIGWDLIQGVRSN